MQNSGNQLSETEKSLQELGLTMEQLNIQQKDPRVDERPVTFNTVSTFRDQQASELMEYEHLCSMLYNPQTSSTVSSLFHDHKF